MKSVYQTYSLETKLKVIQAQSPYYFKEEGVPRTTAIYWLKNHERYEGLLKSSNEFEASKLKNLEKKLEREKAEKKLLKQIRSLHPYSFKKKKVKTKALKKELIDAIQSASKHSSLSAVLSLIELSSSTYYRWLSDFKNCEITGKSCGRRKAHELTKKEIETIRKYVCSKKYAHISISSLCYLAGREEGMYCSQDSWYKYTKINDWRRPRRESFKIKTKRGLRAKEPNEYWHVDISEIKIGRKVYYFQAVIDNFSRYVIEWILSEDKKAANTLRLIKRAQEKSKKRTKETKDKKTSLISDMGSENTAKEVQGSLDEINLESIIARRDISFSNSMIESFFNGLKTWYLNFQKLRTKEDLERKLKFYINEYNDKIPKKGLKGATPKEVYEKLWGEKDLESQNLKRKEAITNRKKNHKKITCGVCS